MSRYPVKVGLVGCGNISGAYLQNARKLEEIEIVACTDVDASRAAGCARDFNIRQLEALDELLAEPDVEIVLNLTPPDAHASIARTAIEAGKSVYNEKPLAVDCADAAGILTTAETRGLHVGCAPDTFLGAGLQTARKLLDEGAIGEPVAGTAFMMSHGPESWHPDPGFFYEVGAGPLFDMGPYYLTALVSMLGSVRRACGSARASFQVRTITSAPKRGREIAVRTPTHIAGVLDFVAGPIVTLVTSFDVWHAEVPFIELYGSAGSLSLPDPNTFDGPVRLRRAEDAEWREAPLVDGHTGDSRGIGLADMARAMRAGGQQRASGRLAYHVLEVMHALLESGERQAHVEIQSTCARPEPFHAAEGDAL